MSPIRASLGNDLRDSKYGIWNLEIPYTPSAYDLVHLSPPIPNDIGIGMKHGCFRLLLDLSTNAIVCNQDQNGIITFNSG